MIFRSIPSAPSTEQFRHRQASLPFSYSNQNGTQTASEISGFDNDRAEVLLGKGDLVWEKAKQAIDAWNSFPKDWTRVFPKSAPTNPGTTIVMYARFAGLWWRNACRIVYTIDQANRYGFAYGTLPGHVEKGEELFSVERREDGTVWYVLLAYSRPRHWIVKIGYPLTRRIQAKFRKDSCRQMQASINPIR